MSNKQCFCIDANSKEMSTIIKALKRDEKQKQIFLEQKNPCNDFLLTPHIGDVYKGDKQVLDTLSNLMSVAIKDLDNVESIRAANDIVDVVPRDSMTTMPTMASMPEDSDEVNLNTMANSSGNYRGVDNMGLFEDFSCGKVCGRTAPVGFFDTDETKYVLFIMALLFLCSIIFRK